MLAVGGAGAAWAAVRLIACSICEVMRWCGAFCASSFHLARVQMQSVENWQQCRCLQSAVTRGLDTCPTYVAAAMKHETCNYWSHSFHCSWVPARPVFWAGVVPWAAGCYIGIALSNSDPSCPDSSTVSSLPKIHSILWHGKTLQGNCGTNISTFYSNFPVVN